MSYVEPIFKGATRPATIMGVPTKPFVGVCFVGMVAFAAFQTIACVLMIPVLIFAMRTLAKNDDQVFRQMYLKIQTGVKTFRTKKRHGGLAAYMPAGLSRRN